MKVQESSEKQREHRRAKMMIFSIERWSFVHQKKSRGGRRGYVLCC